MLLLAILCFAAAAAAFYASCKMRGNDFWLFAVSLLLAGCGMAAFHDHIRPGWTIFEDSKGQYTFSYKHGFKSWHIYTNRADAVKARDQSRREDEAQNPKWKVSR